MVRADDLALERRLNAPNPVGVRDIVADVLSSAAVYAVVIVGVGQADERAMSIGHQASARLHVVADNGLHGLGA